MRNSTSAKEPRVLSAVVHRAACPASVQGRGIETARARAARSRGECQTPLRPGRGELDSPGPPRARCAIEAELLAHDPSRVLAIAEGLLGSWDRARDALQEAYLYLWEQSEVPTNIDAWLSRAVVRRCLHARRTQMRRMYHEIAAGEVLRLLSAPPGLPSVELQELRVKLGEAIAALPAEFRAAFLLQAAGLDYDEVASRLAVPKGTVRSRIHRARARLARHLTNEAPGPAMVAWRPVMPRFP